MNTNNQSSCGGKTVLRLRKGLSGHLSLVLVTATLTCNAFGQTLTTLHSFGGVPRDGIAPVGGVVIDHNGNLFGTTGVGGSERSGGTLYELSPPSAPGDPWTETILHRFHGVPDGKTPLSRLAVTSTGSLIGTTVGGGVSDQGTAYMFSPAVKNGGWREKIMHSFGSAPDDVIAPDLGLLIAPEGFYGVDQGGVNNTGALYLLTPHPRGATFIETILFSFQARQSGDAALPASEPVRDCNGNFFGVTALGGINDLGAVYEIFPPAVPGGEYTETVLYSFNGTDATLPSGRLLLGAGGVLYGTADGGGTSGAGTVFELDPPATPGDPWIEKTLYNFSGASDGTNPQSGVIADKKGRLLGTAGSVIFMLTPPKKHGNSWKETVLHSFSGPDGFDATTPLTLSHNALYGTTTQGGAFGTGTTFQLTLP
jgi:uncharacterized repeat protein (TIGR03803 family)